MNNKLTIIGITFILISIGLSGCTENGSDNIVEGTYDSVTVAVYAKIDIKNDDGEEMTPNVTINVKGPKSTNSFQYSHGGGLMFCESIVLHEKDFVVVTATHLDELGAFSDAKTLTFEVASDSGRRESYSWGPEISFLVPGGTPSSAELPLNVSVTADVWVYHLYWNSSKSNYDTVTNVSNTIRIDMKPSNGTTLTFYRNTVEGFSYADADFTLKRGESITVTVTNQGSGESDFMTYVHYGTDTGFYYWNPTLNIYVYESQPT